MRRWNAYKNIVCSQKCSSFISLLLCQNFQIFLVLLPLSARCCLLFPFSHIVSMLRYICTYFFIHLHIYTSLHAKALLGSVAFRESYGTCFVCRESLIKERAREERVENAGAKNGWKKRLQQWSIIYLYIYNTHCNVQRNISFIVILLESRIQHTFTNATKAHIYSGKRSVPISLKLGMCDVSARVRVLVWVGLFSMQVFRWCDIFHYWFYPFALLCLSFGSIFSSWICFWFAVHR